MLGSIQVGLRILPKGSDGEASPALSEFDEHRARDICIERGAMSGARVHFSGLVETFHHRPHQSGISD
jgi:hypothetical protein